MKIPTNFVNIYKKYRNCSFIYEFKASQAKNKPVIEQLCARSMNNKF